MDDKTVRPARITVILYSDLLHITQRNSLHLSLYSPQLAVALIELDNCFGKQTENPEFKIFQ